VACIDDGAKARTHSNVFNGATEQAAEKPVPGWSCATSAAKAHVQSNAVTAALKRCATQNQGNIEFFRSRTRALPNTVLASFAR
jgi:hypothetical protein